VKNRDSREGAKARRLDARQVNRAKQKYKPYPKYKDSGVEWLGRVPEHWDQAVTQSMHQSQKLRGFAPSRESNRALETHRLNTRASREDAKARSEVTEVTE